MAAVHDQATMGPRWIVFVALIGTALGGVFDFTEFDDPLSTVHGISQARGEFHLYHLLYSVRWGI